MGVLLIRISNSHSSFGARLDLCGPIALNGYNNMFFWINEWFRRSCAVYAINSPSYNHMEKADFLYFEVEAPNGINLITFRHSSVTFSAKIRKKIRCVFK